MNDIAISETAATLTSRLGADVVAFVTNSTPAQVRKWARNEARPSNTQCKQLTTAEDFIKRARISQGDERTRVWFSAPTQIGSKRMSPAGGIRDCLFEEVEAACARFISGDLS